MNIARQTAVISIMAIGMAFALSAGEIDLSVSSNIALTALVTAVAVRNYGLIVGILSGLSTGLLVGVFNGGIVAFVRVPSFLVTLTSMGIISALARWITNLKPVPIGNDRYNYIFGSGDIRPIPILFIWTIGVLIISFLLLKNSIWKKNLGHWRQ